MPSPSDREEFDSVMVGVYRKMRQEEHTPSEAAYAIGISYDMLDRLLQSRSDHRVPSKIIAKMKIYAWPDVYRASEFSCL